MLRTTRDSGVSVDTPLSPRYAPAMLDPIRDSRALRRARERVATCSLRAAIARWIARRAVPAVFPRVNPLARALLRSPLHRLMSGRVLVLRFRGRRSGARYDVPVVYSRAEDGALEAATSVYGRWWRNLESGAPVSVLFRGRTAPARVEGRASGGFAEPRGGRGDDQAGAGVAGPGPPRRDAGPGGGDGAAAGVGPRVRLRRGSRPR